MKGAQNIVSPLISVVIPCYNHGHYLGKAIESVLGQSYSHVEVLVVDDGSSDNTREVALSYGTQVRYVHKQNGGLSAARNTGIEQAKGDYLVFLDADDWLYPTAIETNLRYLQQNPQAAFVSGAHDKIFLNKDFKYSVVKNINSDHYIEFLKGNYVGVPAAVMYQRWVLQELRYDETLKACEDYDLYLRIARNYPVLHHTEKVAAYMIRPSSMSSDPFFMLKSALEVLGNQKKELSTKKEKLAYQKGRNFWKRYYCQELYKKVVRGEKSFNKYNLNFLFKNQPAFILKLFYRVLLKPKTIFSGKTSQLTP